MTIEDGDIFGVPLEELNGVAEITRRIVSERNGIPLDTLPTFLIDPRIRIDAQQAGVPLEYGLERLSTGGEIESAMAFTITPEMVARQAGRLYARWNTPETREKAIQAVGGEANLKPVSAHLATISTVLSCLGISDDTEFLPITNEVFTAVGKYTLQNVKK
jgi:hypothetical protein